MTDLNVLAVQWADAEVALEEADELLNDAREKRNHAQAAVDEARSVFNSAVKEAKAL